MGDFPTNLSQLELYKNKVNQYQKELEIWQDKYSRWKGERESAIGEAEGIINKFNQDYGKVFKVNLGQHWARLGLIIGIMLLLISLVQKMQ